MKQITPLILLLSIVSLASCNRHPENQTVDFALPPPPPQDELSYDRKIIKTGNLKLLTSDIEATRESIYKSINKFEGYVSNESSSGYSKGDEVRLRIRVPSENFDSLLRELQEGKEKLQERSISLEDVTSRYIDQETRIRVKRELEERYLSLLSKADNVEVILQIEKELSKVREEIEVFETSFKNLSNLIEYATLNVTFYTEFEKPDPFIKRVILSFGDGKENLKSLILGVISIWPYIFMMGLAVLLWRILKAKRKSKV